MKIYTKQGDTGETSLRGGARVGKEHARIEAYGSLDELNATIGLARAELARSDRADGSAVDGLDHFLELAQNRLFDLGAELADPDATADSEGLLGEEHLAPIEQTIDRLEEGLPPLRRFILPGGAAAAAQLHHARCVCRRAERLVVALSRDEPVRGFVVRYLNRLGDALFVVARAANRAEGVDDVPWEQA